MIKNNISKKDLIFSLEEELTFIQLSTDYKNQEFVVFVEGSNDKIFYRRTFPLNQRKFYLHYPVSSENNKQRVIDLARAKMTFAKSVAIIDTDFDKILIKKIDDQNIFLTDYHDMEMFVFMSEATDKVLEYFNVTTEKLNKLIGKNNSFKDFILEKSSILGQLRLLKIKYREIDLNFKHVYRNRYNSSKIAEEKYRDSTLFSKGLFTSFEETVSFLLSLRHTKQIKNPLSLKLIKQKLESDEQISNCKILEQLCHGRDVLSVAVFYLNRHLRVKSRKSIVDYDHFLMAYEPSFFHKTSLFANFSIFTGIS